MPVAEIFCRGCDLQMLGSSLVRYIEKHGSLCSQCRGEPIGVEGEKRKHEVCSYCGKEYDQHGMFS